MRARARAEERKDTLSISLASPTADDPHHMKVPNDMATPLPLPLPLRVVYTWFRLDGHLNAAGFYLNLNGIA